MFYIAYFTGMVLAHYTDPFMLVAFATGIVMFVFSDKSLRGYMLSLMGMIACTLTFKMASLPAIIQWQRELGREPAMTDITIVTIAAITAGVLLHVLIAAMYYAVAFLKNKSKRSVNRGRARKSWSKKKTEG